MEVVEDKDDKEAAVGFSVCLFLCVMMENKRVRWRWWLFLTVTGEDGGKKKWKKRRWLWRIIVT